MQQAESVKLNRVQSRYLEGLRATTGLPVGLRLDGLVLEGPRDAIESLRDKLTDILAERGFGEDYSTTGEGEIVEDLIDTLYTLYLS